MLRQVLHLDMVSSLWPFLGRVFLVRLGRGYLLMVGILLLFHQDRGYHQLVDILLLFLLFHQCREDNRKILMVDHSQMELFQVWCPQIGKCQLARQLRAEKTVSVCLLKL